MIEKILFNDRIKISCFIFILFFSFAHSFAHFEPPKTLKEREKYNSDRKFILENRIESITVWKFKIIDGVIDSNQKFKYYEECYNKDGNLFLVVVFNEDGSEKYRDIYTYDDFMNVISITGYSNGEMIEKSEFKYDSLGRVVEQINYNKSNELDSRFVYKIENENKRVLFNKYNSKDIIEYQIIYIYDGDPDYGNNIEIIKQQPDGKLIMRVENTFGSDNLRIQKRIYNENNQLSYYFAYKYFNNTDKFSEIEKISAENKILSKTYYTLNSSGLIKLVVNYNQDNKIDSYFEYYYNNVNK